MDGIEVTLPNATRNFYVDGHIPQPHWSWINSMSSYEGLESLSYVLPGLYKLYNS